MSRQLEIFTDGACSGNPGLASIGFVIHEDGKKIKEHAKPIGEATNNIAEYTAVVYALQEALILKADEVTVNTDSELLFHQVNGAYKVKNENIKTLFDQVQHLASGFKVCMFKHIPREENQDADTLAKNAIKGEQTKVVASSAKKEGEESPSSEG